VGHYNGEWRVRRKGLAGAIVRRSQKRTELAGVNEQHEENADQVVIKVLI